MWIRMVREFNLNAKKEDLKFVDYDGDGTIGFGDRQYMGSATPKTNLCMDHLDLLGRNCHSVQCFKE